MLTAEVIAEGPLYMKMLNLKHTNAKRILAFEARASKLLALDPEQLS